jgi:hypothetical protein
VVGRGAASARSFEPQCCSKNSASSKKRIASPGPASPASVIFVPCAAIQANILLKKTMPAGRTNPSFSKLMTTSGGHPLLACEAKSAATFESERPLNWYGRLTVGIGT